MKTALPKASSLSAQGSKLGAAAAAAAVAAAGAGLSFSKGGTPSDSALRQHSVVDLDTLFRAQCSLGPPVGSSSRDC